MLSFLNGLAGDDVIIELPNTEKDLLKIGSELWCVVKDSVRLISDSYAWL